MHNMFGSLNTVVVGAKPGAPAAVDVQVAGGEGTPLPAMSGEQGSRPGPGLGPRQVYALRCASGEQLRAAARGATQASSSSALTRPRLLVSQPPTPTCVPADSAVSSSATSPSSCSLCSMAGVEASSTTAAEATEGPAPAFSDSSSGRGCSLVNLAGLEGYAVHAVVHGETIGEVGAVLLARQLV